MIVIVYVNYNNQQKLYKYYPAILKKNDFLFCVCLNVVSIIAGPANILRTSLSLFENNLFVVLCAKLRIVNFGFVVIAL